MSWLMTWDEFSQCIRFTPLCEVCDGPRTEQSSKYCQKCYLEIEQAKRNPLRSQTTIMLRWAKTEEGEKDETQTAKKKRPTTRE
jgi:hypothetical protein